MAGIDYETLGLGRGVNVTDTHMWKNKSSFVVRKISDTNIIKTEESGMFEKYEKVVSTISQEQQKIRLLLDDPSSQIKIGMDAQQTKCDLTHENCWDENQDKNNIFLHYFR